MTKSRDMNDFSCFRHWDTHIEYGLREKSTCNRSKENHGQASAPNGAMCLK